jgi:hypothetical protein
LLEQANREFFPVMETPEPGCPPCAGCGKQPHFITSMLDPKAGRTFHMFQCQCGEKFWISEKT